jgi:N-acylneuraminate cytidylyltransferase
MNNLCIIPARGGSKRIKRKNIKFFLGKPIIYYSIQLAQKSKLFNEIVVSTDDTEIAEIAKSYGASVPFFRSKKNSNDFATTTDVVLEVVDDYLNKFNKSFENICCIYPTSPLTKIEDLKKGYNIISKSKTDMVFPITKFSYPILRSFIIDKVGNLKMKWPQYKSTRSQDLPNSYHDCGQWYWYSSHALMRNIFEKLSYVELRNIDAQDIDNEDDWDLAELKYKKINNIK